MRFGTAKDLITPFAPMKLACVGVFDNEFSGIHDDVYVRCLVLDDGNEKSVLMSFDLLFHDRALNDEIASYAEQRYGIKPSAFVVSYTHAHTAPAAYGYNPGHHNDEYEKFLLLRAKTCLDRAMCSMFEGTFEYGCFDADFNISRRGIVNGEFTNSPNYDYPHDTEFWVICVRDTAENIRSVVTNYACHPVFYPTKDSVSGEFPARLCQLLDIKYYGCTSLYFQSSAGDVRPRPTAGEENGRGLWKRLSFSDIDDFAKNMCDSVCEFIEHGGCKKDTLSIASDAFGIKLEMDGRSLAYFEDMMREMETGKDNPNRVNAFLIAQGGYAKLSDSLTLQCQTVRVTDKLYLATVGGEPCFGVKNAVKAAFGDKDVCFMGYTDACAYIVDDRILSEGGYEPTCHLEYGLKGPFKPGLDKLYTDNFTMSYNKLSDKA